MLCACNIMSPVSECRHDRQQFPVMCVIPRFHVGKLAGPVGYRMPTVPVLLLEDRGHRERRGVRSAQQRLLTIIVPQDRSCRKGSDQPSERMFVSFVPSPWSETSSAFASLELVRQGMGKVRVAFYKPSIEVRESKKHLEIPVILWLWPLGHRFDPLGIHPDALSAYAEAQVLDVVCEELVLILVGIQRELL